MPRGPVAGADEGSDAEARLIEGDRSSTRYGRRFPCRRARSLAGRAVGDHEEGDLPRLPALLGRRRDADLREPLLHQDRITLELLQFEDAPALDAEGPPPQ